MIVMTHVQKQNLIKKAIAAMRRSYAPYSRFCVGAALLTREGRVFQGCNVENASYGLTMCAERTALGAAIAAGYRSFTALAVVSGGQTTPVPCGACLQTLAEFCRPDFVILTVAERDPAHPAALTLKDLLPKAFRLK